MKLPSVRFELTRLAVATIPVPAPWAQFIRRAVAEAEPDTFYSFRLNTIDRIWFGMAAARQRHDV